MAIRVSFPHFSANPTVTPHPDMGPGQWSTPKVQLFLQARVTNQWVDVHAQLRRPVKHPLKNFQIGNWT